MYSQGSKIAVLESKLNMYEELTREMLQKLETAVDKISEGNSRIAAILAKHDEKIEQSNRNNDIIVKMIDDVKSDNENEHQEMSERFERVENQLNDVVKFRWILVGAVVIISFTFSQSRLVVDMLTPDPQPVRIEQVK